MIELTENGDTIYLHPAHILKVESDSMGSGADVHLSTDKKLTVEETALEVAIRVANTVSWYFRPRLSGAVRDAIRAGGCLWEDMP